MQAGKYYVLAKGNNLFEGMTKEQIIAAIVEATGETPTNIDDAFITKIKEQNRNNNLKFWIGTTAEYNALDEYVPNCFYIFSDSNELVEIIEAAENAAEAKANEVCEELQGDVEQAQTDIENIQNTLAMKGVVLCEDSGSPPSLVDKTVNNIEKYSLVAVNVMGAGLVLCSVQAVEISGTQTYMILGAGTGMLTSSNSIWRFFVKIIINASTKKVTETICYSSAQMGTAVANPSTAYASKIIGIL